MLEKKPHQSYGCSVSGSCVDDVITAVQLDKPELLHHYSFAIHQHGEEGRTMSSFSPRLAMFLLTVFANISTAPSQSCPAYRTLSDPWRNVGFCSSIYDKNDSKLIEGWYTFSGVSGDQVVPSCVPAQNITNASVTNYNLFTCNSSINSTNVVSCSNGLTAYYLRPIKGIYSTRHSSCNSSSCGPNAYCGTVYGSCVCNPGFIYSANGCIIITVSADFKNATSAYNFLDNLEKLLNNTGPLEQKTVELYLDSIMNVSSIIENSTDNIFLISFGNKVLSVTEKLLVSLVTPTETQNSTSITLSNLESQVYTVGNKTSLSEIPLLNTSNSSLDIDLIGISKKNNGSAAVIFVSYSNMDNILKPSFFKPNSSTNKIMMSSVVSATLPNITSMSFTKPIHFTFKHTQDLVKAANLSCVYWNESVWVEDGCSITENKTYSVCTCTHLSTFALIMQVNPNQIPSGGYDELIEIINIVGVSVGMLFLFLTVLTLAVCQRGQKVTNVALLNLSISLFSAHLVFLLKEQFLENIKFTVLCEVLAGVIHFFFLSAFVWMFIEAVLLYFFVKNLSQMGSKDSELLTWKCLIVIGYVIPLVFMGLFSGLIPNPYTDDVCWINTAFVWAFLGPVIAIIAINFLLSCAIIVILRRALLKLDSSVSKLKHTRSLVLKTLLQFVILGCPWVLGLFTRENKTIDIAFICLNSQQGTIIFIVHCALNQEIRQQYRKWWADIRHCSKYKSMAEDQSRASNMHLN
ncbi:adhesion G protein-coupled receptor E3-like isoform X1 [Tachysurus vachellii]|uniref:adhesion G protein-coupled receptor E3-like isoform X1 n=1 Tax=Tachysurus vachellii TaxID=175792 RepID=UPI00296ADCA4|nr:adhesion G protein-coupled receptor E3-like isoform X1 [Tachysurus vachellii]